MTAPPLDSIPLAGTDVLDHADPEQVADAAAVENLLRCWLRETGTVVSDGLVQIDLPASGTCLHVELRHASPSGWHRIARAWFGEARDTPADAATVAALLAREAAVLRDAPPHTGGDLVARVVDSVRRVATHVAERRVHPADPPGTPSFLAAEQALLLGHPLHPTPKSREALDESEARAYAPELRGSFPLHWFAADPAVVASDSALAGPAAAILARLVDVDSPTGTVLVPAHPWQARELRRRPAIARLIDDGLLHDLGPAGPAWYPTSSLRTVYRPDADVMLKLSLGLRITNSRRENLRKELHRGVEVTRLLDAGLGARIAAAHPGFGIVRDPAWLAVGAPGDLSAESGLDVVMRENPFPTGTDVDAVCVAGLVAERPGLGPSRLGQLIAATAERDGEPTGEVAAEWLRRYVRVVATPVWWLYSTYGLALEAHQQNTLVILDADGWPTGGRYRDNQGYYFASSRVAELERFVPDLGRASDTVVPDEVVDERLGYYLGVNNLLGLVGAFGSQGLADETVLLSVLRDELAALTRELDPVPLALRNLLEQPRLRAKANLLTRLHGMDELVGPVSTQSVYVDIPNPVTAHAYPARGASDA